LSAIEFNTATLCLRVASVGRSSSALMMCHFLSFC
jgi:hypothetical protein